MNNSPDNSTLENGAGERQGMEDQPREWQPDTLHALARAYFGNEFPNPDRHACPDHTSLLATVQTGRLPDDALRAHLFGCSACFTEYQMALATRHAIVPAITGQAAPRFWLTWPAKLRAAFTRQPGFAWAFVAALFLTVFLFTWTRWRSSANPPSIATPNLAQTQPATNPAPSVLVESPAPAPQPPTSPTEATVTVRVDLNEYVALRDAAASDGQGKPALKLTPVQTQLRLRLPEGSLAGTYTVRLLDEWDKPVVTATMPSHDGQRLTVNLDLRSVAAQRYQLQLQLSGEPPSLYPVLVNAKEKKR